MPVPGRPLPGAREIRASFTGRPSAHLLAGGCQIFGWNHRILLRRWFQLSLYDRRRARDVVVDFVEQKSARCRVKPSHKEVIVNHGIISYKPL
jgi:hypothetical protein